ncbi:hypothetical protein FA13DRAFT_1709803 [Coprinellus micaceus]|uniref:F-box domain-containing protein n=1 Tax=Coprinellus micaceus TaxID=71717 RepID=A0A4Y7TBS9_COPMI|nr:hypothetical protein FA13DRAFT_1709803 [Coprinellus micaceus]
MASRGPSRTRQSKRARTSGLSTAAPGDCKKPEGSSDTLQSSQQGNGKGKQVENAFNFFQDLPADVLGEVTAYLTPVDLLHLSRTTRELRGFLMSASSAVFWKQARQNDEHLPPCPPDLSEPAYAHLLFSDLCHKCLSSEGNVLLHLEARTQLCEPCTLEEFKRWQELPEEVDSALVELVPDTMHQLTPSEKKQNWSKAAAEYQRVARTRFHVATAVKMHREYKKIRGAKQKSIWLAEQKKARTSIEAHAAKCRDYMHGEKRRENDRVWKGKKQRAAQYSHVDEGWGEEYDTRSIYSEVDTPSAPKMSPPIYQDRALTDEEWEEIRNGLLGWMQEVRTVHEWHDRLGKMRQRVESTMGQAYTAFALSQASSPLIPTLAELALTDEFAQPLKAVPLDDDMPDGALDSAISRIPELVEAWKVSVEESLLDLLRQSSAYGNQVNLTKDALSYASTSFTCKHCVGILTYPSILAHPCFSTSTASTSVELMGPDKRTKRRKTLAAQSFREGRNGTSGYLLPATFGQMHGRGGSYRVWHPGPMLQFNEAMHHHTASLLDLLGLDRTTTMTTLLDLNPYVEGVCKCFSQGTVRQAISSPRKATRWSQACRRHRSGDYTSSFNIIGEAEVQGRPGYLNPGVPGSFVRLRCFWCGLVTGSMNWHFTA